MFPSATFCVFSNRFLAIIVAAVVCLRRHGTVQTNAPLWYYTPCALSNTLSSWGQYAALKFVSFPLQVLFKSAKVIPVMLMGRILNKTSYKLVDYAEAVAITLGVATFGLSRDKSPNAKGGGADTELWGLMCLTLYISSDAFTSQWQSRINKHYETSTYQMMFGVNCSAIILTVSALVLSGELPAVFEFLAANPGAIWNNVITAITSATGQTFIFYTIKNFGPVVFTIIMTTRQMISMVISTLLFGHTITFGSYCGAFVVFATLFYNVYRKHKAKKVRALFLGCNLLQEVCGNTRALFAPIGQGSCDLHCLGIHRTRFPTRALRRHLTARLPVNFFLRLRAAGAASRHERRLHVIGTGLREKEARSALTFVYVIALQGWDFLQINQQRTCFLYKLLTCPSRARQPSSKAVWVSSCHTKQPP
jgi:adenosine 3'-phospho 5'-phosphosulfate transporter B2